MTGTAQKAASRATCSVVGSSPGAAHHPRRRMSSLAGSKKKAERTSKSNDDTLTMPNSSKSDQYVASAASKSGIATSFAASASDVSNRPAAKSFDSVSVRARKPRSLRKTGSGRGSRRMRYGARPPYPAKKARRDQGRGTGFCSCAPGKRTAA